MARIERCTDESDVTDILRVLSANVVPDEHTSRLVLEGVKTTSFVKPMIYAIPKLISASHNDMINSLLEVFQARVMEDYELIIPIIGSLSDMDLSPHSRKRAFELSVVSLAVCREVDVPIVLRAVILAMTASCPLTLVHEIRKETSAISEVGVTNIIQVLSSELKINPFAGMCIASLWIT